MTQLRTFIVEDSPLLRENLAGALEELAPISVVGFAEDEFTAISWIRANRRMYDLLIIDIFLKRGSGLGVLSASRKLGAETMVILSNYATDDMRRRCLELGAVKVFDKSSEIDALVEFCIDAAETNP